MFWREIKSFFLNGSNEHSEFMYSKKLNPFKKKKNKRNRPSYHVRKPLLSERCAVKTGSRTK